MQIFQGVSKRKSSRWTTILQVFTLEPNASEKSVICHGVMLHKHEWSCSRFKKHLLLLCISSFHTFAVNISLTRGSTPTSDWKQRTFISVNSSCCSPSVTFITLYTNLALLHDNCRQITPSETILALFFRKLFYSLWREITLIFRWTETAVCKSLYI